MSVANVEEQPQADEPEVPPVPPGKRIDGKLGCGITLVVGIACMGLAWGMMKRKAGAQLDAATELAQIASAAEHAEGTEALKAAGCDRAAVFPIESLRSVAQRLENARAEKEKRDPKDIDLGGTRAAVVCAAEGDKAPTCADVAKTFHGAVKNAALPFVTIVEGKKGAICTQEYGGDAKPMKDVGPFAIPPLLSSEP